MKVVAKQNCYFSCQLWYQRQAAKYRGSLSSFHIFHKSLLHWSSHKYCLWFRNALKYVLLKSELTSIGEVQTAGWRSAKGSHWGPPGQEEEDGKTFLPARWSNFPLTEYYIEIVCQESIDLTAVTALCSYMGSRCLQWFQSIGLAFPQESCSQLVSKCSYI